MQLIGIVVRRLGGRDLVPERTAWTPGTCSHVHLVVVFDSKRLAFVASCTSCSQDPTFAAHGSMGADHLACRRVSLNALPRTESLYTSCMSGAAHT
jgi:hypothetical protein